MMFVGWMVTDGKKPRCGEVFRTRKQAERFALEIRRNILSQRVEVVMVQVVEVHESR